MHQLRQPPRDHLFHHRSMRSHNHNPNHLNQFSPNHSQRRTLDHTLTRLRLVLASPPACLCHPHMAPITPPQPRHHSQPIHPLHPSSAHRAHRPCHTRLHRSRMGRLHRHQRHRCYLHTPTMDYRTSMIRMRHRLYRLVWLNRSTRQWQFVMRIRTIILLALSLNPHRYRHLYRPQIHSRLLSHHSMPTPPCHLHRLTPDHCHHTPHRIITRRPHRRHSPHSPHRAHRAT